MTTKGLLHTSAQFPAILHIFPNFEFLIEDIIKLSGNLARFLWRIFQSLYRIFLNYSQFFNCWKHLPTFTLPLIRHGAGSWVIFQHSQVKILANVKWERLRKSCESFYIL